MTPFLILFALAGLILVAATVHTVVHGDRPREIPRSHPVDRNVLPPLRNF